MPVTQQQRDALYTLAYRPITLHTFADLIGGVRYIGVGGSLGLGGYQLIPYDPQACWRMYTWHGGDRCSTSIRTRAELMTGVSPAFADEWFAKVALLIDTRLPVFSEPMTFTRFVGPCEGGYENLYDVTAAFDARHPRDPLDRAIADVAHTQQQLTARENELRQHARFSQVHMRLAVAETLEKSGMTAMARRVRAEAEELRREIQNRLDQEAQEAIRGMGFGTYANNGTQAAGNVPGNLSMDDLMRTWDQLQAVTYTPSSGSTFTYAPIAPDILPANYGARLAGRGDPAPEQAKPRLEIAVTPGKRKIILED